MTVTAPESVEVRLRHQLREAHSVPQFDLVSLPWIPVVDHAGNTSHVGIEELLAQAHEIRDLAEPDPIVRAALRRFGEALAAHTVRLSGVKRDGWLVRVEDGAGFAANEVEVLVADQREHLWLYHPQSPFLQDIRLIEALVNPELLSTDELTAHLPGRGEAAWFVKPGDPASGAGLDPPAVVRALVTRWFYCLPGNSADVRTPNGNNGAQCGGAFSEGIAPATHAFRVSRLNLATTLMRNLTPDMVAKTGAAILAGPAWSHEDRSAISPDGLYRSSVTTSSTLLASPGRGGRIDSLVRGPVPQDKETVKQVRKLALEHDPHRIIVQSTKKDGGITTKPLRRRASEHPLLILDSLHREALSSGQGAIRGVLTESDLWLADIKSRHDESIELFLADKQGTGSSPKWSEVRIVSLPAAHVDPNATTFQYLVPILTVAFDQKTGVLSKLRWAVLEALDENGPNRHATADRLVTVARTRWLELAAAQIEIAVTNHTPPDECKHGLFVNARRVFQEVMAPYATSTRYAASVIQAQRRLWEKRS